LARLHCAPNVIVVRMDEPSAYDQALDGLYAAFGDYPFRRNMPCCIPHCMDQADLDIMGAMPLRKLTADMMNPFVSNLNTTCGEREDFKFVLPRLLELSANGSFIWPGSDLVLSWLRTEELGTWPNGEQTAVRRFLDAWWERELKTNKHSLFEAFEALGCSGIDVTQWMSRWREDAPASLANWITDNMTMIWSGKFSNSFAEHDPLVREIKAFLSNPETLAALEKAFHDTDDLEEQDMLSLAEHYLRM
jgi:hypothetical protein